MIEIWGGGGDVWEVNRRCYRSLLMLVLMHLEEEWIVTALVIDDLYLKCELKLRKEKLTRLMVDESEFRVDP